MRIAQVCHRYFPYIGGIQTHVKAISEGFFKKGFEVEVLTTDPSRQLPKTETVNGVKVRRFKAWAPNGAYYFSRGLKKYLSKNTDSFDVIHAHGYHAFPALYAAHTKKNKMIFTPHYHGDGHSFFRKLLHVPYRFWGSMIFRKADKIVCVSNYEKSLILKRFKVKDDKLVIIPNGVNLSEFENLTRKRKSYRVILHVGRLEKYKGVDYLIKALPKLDGDIYLDIVGKGPYKRDLVKCVRTRNVTSRVNFYQDLPRKELLQKYADADLVVLLSKFEAYSMTIAEALTAGTPCIVANTSALTEWVDDQNCFGISYPVNVEELSELINHIIGSNNRTYSMNARREKIQDWNEVVERLESIYDSD